MEEEEEDEEEEEGEEEEEEWGGVDRVSGPASSIPSRQRVSK